MAVVTGSAPRSRNAIWGSYEDIVGAGRVGLVKAIDRFELARGNSFITYATCVIVGEIKRHFRDTTWSVHVPRRLQETRRQLRVAAQELAELGIAEPTHQQLAVHLGMGENEIRDARAASNAYSSLSLDMHAPGEDSPTLENSMAEADADLDRVVDLHALRELLGRLPERERTILLLRFYGNKTQSEIGAELGLSQMHVSRLLSRTLRNLRQALCADDADDESGTLAPPPVSHAVRHAVRHGDHESQSAHVRPIHGDKDTAEPARSGSCRPPDTPARPAPALPSRPRSVRPHSVRPTRRLPVIANGGCAVP
jgi:RNA polymerase sigma-B factor